MGKLTDDEARALKDLQAKADAPDEEDFDIEIFDGDKGARVPYSKGRSWLKQTFGIDVGDAPAADAEEGGADDKPAEPVNKKAFGRTIGRAS